MMEMKELNSSALKSRIGEGLIVAWQTRIDLSPHGELNWQETICFLTHEDSDDPKSRALFFVEDAVEFFMNLLLKQHERSVFL